MEIIEVEMRYHMPDDVDVSLRCKMRSFTNCIEDLKRENAWRGSWESQKKDDEHRQRADVTAPLQLESLTPQMAGAAWGSIFLEDSSIKQKEKQTAGV